MNKCPFCGGKLAKGTIIHPHSYRGKIFILENVSAEVCSQCGEVLISPDVLEKMQELVWSGEEPGRKAEVPVYDMAEVG